MIESDFLTDEWVNGKPSKTGRFCKIIIILLSSIVALSLFRFYVILKEVRLLFISQNRLLLITILVERLIPLLALCLFIARYRIGWLLVMIISMFDLLVIGYTFTILLLHPDRLERIKSIEFAFRCIPFVLSGAIVIFGFKAPVLSSFKINRKWIIIMLALVAIVLFFINTPFSNL